MRALAKGLSDYINDGLLEPGRFWRSKDNVVELKSDMPVEEELTRYGLPKGKLTGEQLQAWKVAHVIKEPYVYKGRSTRVSSWSHISQDTK